MALIQCSECGKEVSDKAIKCPNCGCPIYDDEKKYSNHTMDDHRVQSATASDSNYVKEIPQKVKAAIGEVRSSYQKSDKENTIEKIKSAYCDTSKESKKTLLICIFVLVALIILLCIICPNKYENIAIRDCKTLKTMCISPSSFEVYDALVYHEDEYGDVSIINYGADNAFGSCRQSTCMFVDGAYWGDFNDSESDFYSQESYDKFLIASLRYALWKAQGADDAGLRFQKIHRVDANMINRRLH